MTEFHKIKKYLEARKKKIKQSFYEIQDGLDTVKKLSKLTDEIIKFLFSKNTELQKVVICAVGGYGRSELAPFSDIDIIFILENSQEKKSVEKEIIQILYKLWDLDFKIGYSVRKLDEIFEITKKDQVIATSILDIRYICGNYQTYKKAQKIFKTIFKNEDKFLKEKIIERENRAVSNKEVSFLLEPDIKNSRGGLRDLNLIFWFLKTKYGTVNLEILKRKKLISDFELRKIESLKSFLMKARCHLHYFHGRANDRLTFDSQKKISYYIGYRSRKKTLGVERFMKHYYLQVRISINLLYIVFAYFDNERLQVGFSNKLKKIFSKNNYLEKEKTLLVRNEKLFLSNPENFFIFFLMCLKKNLLPHYRVLRLIFNKIQFNGSKQFNSNRIYSLFSRILMEDKKNIIFELIHEVGLISKVIPKFSNILCQAQFDRYHLYTVDQHTMKALKTLKYIDNKEEIEKEFFFTSKVLERIKNKKILYFSTLFHDIGKGYIGNHNVVGSKITQDICGKFDLSEIEIQEIQWLIVNHSKFYEAAFKSDLDDREFIQKISNLIKSQDRLMCLFVLNVVDISSVNENSWTEWKQSLIIKLYKKCEEQLFYSGRRMHKKDLLSIQKQKAFEYSVISSFGNFNKLEEITCDNFWLMQSPKKIAQQLDLFFSDESLFNHDNYELVNDKVTGFLELTIFKKDRKRLLLDIVKLITYSEMRIFEARVFTLKNRMAIDIFKISPIQFKTSFNDEDLDYYNNILRKNLKLFFEKDNCEDFYKDKLFISKNSPRKRISVKFNKDERDYNTLNVTTNDRQFLLLDILEAIISFDCEVYSAKILTQGEFVEDIFHIKRNGLKINNDQDLRLLRKMIKEHVV